MDKHNPVLVYLRQTHMGQTGVTSVHFAQSPRINASFFHASNV